MPRAPTSPSSARSSGRRAAENATGWPRLPLARTTGAASKAPSASKSRSARMVAGATSGMSPSATIQPSARPVAAIAAARLAPMPSDVRSDSTTSQPADSSAVRSRSAPSAITASALPAPSRRLRAERVAMAPSLSSPGIAARSFSEPKRFADPPHSSKPRISTMARRFSWRAKLRALLARVLGLLEHDAVALGDEVGEDRDRDLGRRARADGKPHGAVQLRDLLRGEVELREAPPAFRVGARGAHRADVRGIALQR